MLVNTGVAASTGGCQRLYHPVGPHPSPGLPSTAPVSPRPLPPQDDPLLRDELRRTDDLPANALYASEMLRLGVSLPALMQLLGRKDIRMTLRYVQVTQQDLQREFHTACKR